MARMQEDGAYHEDAADKTFYHPMAGSPKVKGPNPFIDFIATAIYKLKIFINHDAFKAVQMMFVVTFNLYNVSGAYVSSYYYFENGRMLGNAISTIFCEFDFWSDRSLITPTKPWVRRQQKE